MSTTTAFIVWTVGIFLLGLWCSAPLTTNALRLQRKHQLQKERQLEAREKSLIEAVERFEELLKKEQRVIMRKPIYDEEASK